MEYESNMADVVVAFILLLVDEGELETTRQHRRNDMYLILNSRIHRSQD